MFVVLMLLWKIIQIYELWYGAFKFMIMKIYYHVDDGNMEIWKYHVHHEIYLKLTRFWNKLIKKKKSTKINKQI